MARDIFISYSRKDKDKVFPFVEEINKTLGYDECWIDLEGIESGEQFENVIINAIDTCRVVLFMLSDNSLSSNWTKREVYYAERKGKRIIPVLMDGREPRGWFIFHFGDVDYINIDNAEQKEKLIKNLKAQIDKRDGEEQQKDGFVVKTDSPSKPVRTTLFQKRWKHCLYITLGLIVLCLLWFLFTPKNTNVQDPAAHDAMFAIPDSCFHLVRVDSLLGFANDSGVTMIPARWKYADRFCEGLARVVDENGKYGFIDKTGTLTIACNWKFADNFCEGLAQVVDENNNWGCIDKKGEEVIPC